MTEPPRPLLVLMRVVDAVNEWSGRVFAWLIIPLVLGLTYEVIMRYGFDAPTIWAYDTAYMLYGSHFMLGAAYTLLKRGHIRTDFFYDHWPVRRQAAVDAFCYLFLFFPGMIFFFWAAWDAAAHSWLIRETSEASAWRPPIYPFKTVMPVSALLVLLQGVSELIKCFYALRMGRWP